MILAEVVVGSRLWGLELPESDVDTRIVEALSFMAIISPWGSGDAERRQEEGRDTVWYEARAFCRLATNGNPAMQEVLYSNQPLFTSPAWDELDPAWFYDPQRIARAHLRFAKSQRDALAALWSRRNANAKQIGKVLSAGALSMMLAIDLLSGERPSFHLPEGERQLHVDLRHGHRLTDGSEYLDLLERQVNSYVSGVADVRSTISRYDITMWLGRVYAGLADMEIRR